MDRQEIVNGLAGQMLKEAADEVLSSPLMKQASEEEGTQAVADKIAEVYVQAEAIYKVAEEQYEAADEQGEIARQALIENGVDPDAVIAAAAEAAQQELQAQEAVQAE